MLPSNAQSLCPRLIDYLVVVGAHHHAVGSKYVQDPCLLKCFPEKFHEDFELPKDVVYFCQPEGCISGQVSTLELDTTSFIFTLTEKDSGTIRFGISLNFFRSCKSTRDATMQVQDNNSNNRYEHSDVSLRLEEFGAHKETLLTSLCIISHHPFFSKFRECLHTLKHIMEAGQSFFDKLQRNSGTSWSLWNLFLGQQNVKDEEDRQALPVIDLLHEIEFWIYRLLSTPAPLAGKSCIQLTILPEALLSAPLTFALPDKTRLSLIDFPLHFPLELLGVETCLKVLTAIMLEQKVILQSRDYNALTMSVLAFTALLYPLQYMFPAIPLLPNNLDGAENLLLSPTPYLIGIPATFLNQKKQFLIPPDVWLIDLDGNRMMGSKNIEPIHPLPQTEGKELVERLEQALSLMRSNQVIPSTTDSTILSNTNVSVPQHPVAGDVDVVDVATRVAMVQFFNSPNVLANLSEHTRTIRLYPRPVVAFQYYSFLKSRQNLTPFIRRLAQTQAVEFLSEWSLYPENEVFQRIYAGITDPALIGDKAKWFATSLPQICYPVWNKSTGALIELVLCWAAQSRVCKTNSDSLETHPPMPEFDYAQYRAQCHFDLSAAFCPPRNTAEQLRGALKARPSVRRRKKTRPSEVTDQTDRNSGQFGSVPDDRALASQITFDQSHSVWDSSADSSSELSDADIWDLTVNESEKNELVAETDVINADVTHQTNEKSITSISQNETPKQDTHSDQYLESGKESNLCNSLNSNALKITDQEAKGEVIQRDSIHQEHSLKDQSGSEDELEEASVGRLLLTNLSENIADAASHASSTLSVIIDKQKDMVKKSRGFARKVVSELKQDAGSSSAEPKSPTMSIDSQSPDKRSGFFNSPKSLFSFGQSATNKNTNLSENLVLPSLHTDPDQSVKDQEFLRSVVDLVNSGRTANYTTGSRLRELLIDENYRSYLMSKINTGRNQLIGDPEQTLADCELLNEPVYKSFVWLLQCMLRGLEQTCTNHGIGGLASAMAMLEVCHTHYVDPHSRRHVASNGVQNSSNQGLARKNDENIVDSFTDWWRSTTRGLRSKVPTGDKSLEKTEDSNFSSKLTNQMTGFLSKANRLIGSTESNKETTKDRSQSQTEFDLSSVARCVSGIVQEGATDSVEASDDQDAGPTVQDHDEIRRFETNRIIRKSCLAGSYRYVSGKLVLCENVSIPVGHPENSRVDSNTSTVSCNVPSQSMCTRTYLYEAFVRPKQRSRLWDHMQFWEDTFFDTVAHERDVLGLDQAPMEMLEKFNKLSSVEKRILQCKEDRLLATCLYNTIACMVMMQVDRDLIRTRVRRIQARCRLGSYFANALSHLLDELQYLEGNAIDLLPTMTQCNCLHSFQVQEVNRTVHEPKIFEIYQNCVVLRELTGAIATRMDYDASFNVMLSADEKLVVITLKRNGVNVAQSFYSDQAKIIYTSIKTVLETNRGSGKQA